MHKQDIEIVIVIGLISQYTRESPTIIFDTLKQSRPRKSITRTCVARANVCKQTTSIIDNQVYFRPYIFMLTHQGLQLWRINSR